MTKLLIAFLLKSENCENLSFGAKMQTAKHGKLLKSSLKKKITSKERVDIDTLTYT